MEYQEFLYAVKEGLNKKFNKGTRASIYETTKNNGLQKKGVMIEREGSNIGPTIYLEEFYDRYKEGETLEHLLEEIMEFYDSVKCTEKWDCRRFEEYESIKEKIVCRLISFPKNEDSLREIPHVKILDLAVIFYVLLEVADKGMATITVRNEHMKVWKVSCEELYEQAVKNSNLLLPAQFYTMHQAIEELMDECDDHLGLHIEDTVDDEEEVMFILTNSYRNFGAVCLIYPHVLEMIGNMLGENFYILPSSIHEVIIVPESKGIGPDVFDSMINEINETQVAPEEILGDHSYLYLRNENELCFRQQKIVMC